MSIDDIRSELQRHARALAAGIDPRDIAVALETIAADLQRDRDETMPPPGFEKDNAVGGVVLDTHTYLALRCALSWTETPPRRMQLARAWEWRDDMLARLGAHGYAPAPAERPHKLTWNGTEWVAPCGCRYHPDDDNGSHGGAPHVHPCEGHIRPHHYDEAAKRFAAAERPQDAPRSEPAAGGPSKQEIRHHGAAALGCLSTGLYEQARYHIVQMLGRDPLTGEPAAGDRGEAERWGKMADQAHALLDAWDDWAPRSDHAPAQFQTLCSTFEELRKVIGSLAAADP